MEIKMLLVLRDNQPITENTKLGVLVGTLKQEELQLFDGTLKPQEDRIQYDIHIINSDSIEGNKDYNLMLCTTREDVLQWDKNLSNYSIDLQSFIETLKSSDLVFTQNSLYLEGTTFKFGKKD